MGALHPTVVVVRLQADDRARLWTAEIDGLPGPAAQGSTLPNALRALADTIPSLALVHGLDWSGYHDTLPCQLRGDYW